MQDKRIPWHFLALLILAGECVFILPFVLARVFRPTVLKAFEIDNLELGFCFSVYGIVAFVSYPFGGPLADKYPPQKLIAMSLWLTALGGLVYASFPSLLTLKVLYGYWGFTTIFLFWAPMIKATRVWGGKRAQGKAFGFLDGGRGLVGAFFGVLGVLIFSLVITTDIEDVTVEASRAAFKQVILVTSAIVATVGILVWFFMKLSRDIEQEIVLEHITVSQIKEVLRLPSVQLLMIIIMCAYVGYKITDIFSLYAEDILGYDLVESAQVGTFLLFIRPVVGVAIGILADKTRTTLWLLVSFIVAIIGALLFATGTVVMAGTVFFFLSTLMVAIGVYAVRSLYFAVMERGQIPLVLTGTAVGLVSLIGYTPDIFASPAMGYLLENTPGVQGHQQVFWMLIVFYTIGAIAAYKYFKRYGRSKHR